MVVVNNSALDYNDALFIVNNIISRTTDSALYLALRLDSRTIAGNRIDRIGVDGFRTRRFEKLQLPPHRIAPELASECNRTSDV